MPDIEKSVYTLFLKIINTLSSTHCQHTWTHSFDIKICFLSFFIKIQVYMIFNQFWTNQIEFFSKLSTSAFHRLRLSTSDGAHSGLAWLILVQVFEMYPKKVCNTWKINWLIWLEFKCEQFWILLKFIEIFFHNLSLSLSLSTRSFVFQKSLLIAKFSTLCQLEWNGFTIEFQSNSKHRWSRVVCVRVFAQHPCLKNVFFLLPTQISVQKCLSFLRWSALHECDFFFFFLTLLAQIRQRVCFHRQIFLSIARSNCSRFLPTASAHSTTGDRLDTLSIHSSTHPPTTTNTTIMITYIWYLPLYFLSSF